MASATAPDPRTGLVALPAGRRCRLSTGSTSSERVGWALSALALLLTLLTAVMHPSQRSRVMPANPN